MRSSSAKIAVFHPRIMARGGSEAVALHTIRALQRDHSVRLLTFDDPRWDDLEEFHGITVSPVPTPDTRKLELQLLGCDRLFSVVDRYITPDPYSSRLRNALLSRHLERRVDSDLLISTYNEYSTGRRGLCYVHFPTYSGDWDREATGIRAVYDRLCDRVAPLRPDRILSNQLLANSAWTANRLRDLYGVQPKVLYPPVNGDLSSRPVSWEEREHGFVMVTRIVPDKRVERAVRIVEELNRTGHDVHLHIAGPVGDEAYLRRLNRLIAGRDFVHLEGPVPRERLVDLMTRHRYGLQAKQEEHFGIAVAEIASAGALPFVPAGGGQVEIVHDHKDLTYRDEDDAVFTISRVLEDADRQRRLRNLLSGVPARFSSERFRREIRRIVKRLLAERSPVRSAGRPPGREKAPSRQHGTRSRN